MSIAEVRERAETARRQLRDWTDPIIKREKAKASARRITVAEAIDGCFKVRQAELKNDGEAGRWMSPLNVHVIPKIGRYPIKDINQHMLKDLLGPIWHDTGRGQKRWRMRLRGLPWA